MKRIYLDYASLTPIDKRAEKAMKEFSSDSFANPSSLYKEGVAAKNALKDAREKVSAFIHSHPDEIFFTSGGTESNALAIMGAVNAAQKKGISKPHVVVSSVEHSSVIETASHLEEKGIEVTRLDVDEKGSISLDGLKKSLKPETVIVSIMAVNNELGVIEPLRDIAKVIRDYRKTVMTDLTGENPARYPLLHVDAAQSIHMEINMEKLGADLLTLDSNKTYGPRGVGALYIKRNTSISPIIAGGGQEGGIRSGTENIPGICGFAKSLEIVTKERTKESVRISELRQLFIQGLKKIDSGIKVNGYEDGESQSPHILNVTIPNIDAEFFVLQLDAKGIACSTKSSCLRDADESYVLNAIGAKSKNSVRFSFGRWTEKSDIKKSLKIVSSILNK